MLIGSCIVTFHAPWVTSLKEKRMIVKSMIDKIRNKFNVSIAEVDSQDNHNKIVVGFACVTNEVRHADSMIEHILDFMENHTEAEIISVEKEIL